MFQSLFKRRQPVAIVNPELIEAQRRIEELQALVRQQVVELDEYRAMKHAPTRAKAAKAPKPVKLTSLEFWRLHGQAVDAIRAGYGDSWKVHGPFGETELVTVTHTRAKTERGTVLKWSADQRVPAARYWPGEAFPEGVTVNADYPRHDATAARAIWKKHTAPRWTNRKAPVDQIADAAD